MPFAFYICAGITAIVLIFALAQIVSRLNVIHKDLCRANEYLAEFHVKETLLKYFSKESKPDNKNDRTEATKRYTSTHRLVLDRKLGKQRWVKKSECHRELNTSTGKEIWVANE